MTFTCQLDFCNVVILYSMTTYFASHSENSATAYQICVTKEKTEITEIDLLSGKTSMVEKLPEVDTYYKQDKNFKK